MEYWDIYDINREKTGKVMERKNKVWFKENEYHLGVHVCLFNSKDEMLIQKRQITRQADPGKWDFSARGSVLKGETAQEGASREMFEELGINYDFSNERAKFTINLPNIFDDYFFAKMDVDIDDLKLQEEEVESAKWASKDEIIELISQDKFAKCSKELIEFIYFLYLRK